MAYIYCIENQINQKKYVGKTTYSITKRFLEHCIDSTKPRCEKRPLYDAMNKYGIDNFIVYQLIECDELELSSYEIMFIEKLNTFGNSGYNATKGGDGKILFDYLKIISLYELNLTMKQVALQLHCCVDTVSKVIHLYNIPTHKLIVGNCQLPKKVRLLNKDSLELILEFDSMACAAHWLVDNGYAKTYNGSVRGKISQCCNNKLKTAYKFKWEFSK